jgi:hypothetical protein
MPTVARPRSVWAPPRPQGHRPGHSGAPGGPAAVYRRRRPTATPLYPIVQHHLETFLARAAEADPWGEGVAGWVEDDFRAYLRCGILAHGFARVRCDDCAAERLVAFSCKGRGVCPSCNARRMVEVAAHLNDAVLPPLPIRQWVLSVPKRIRPFFHHDPALAGAVLRVLLRAVRTRLRHDSPGAGPNAQIGAVSFLHRFGSSLNPHFHFHVVVLDGVFTEIEDGEVRFDEATHFSGSHASALTPALQRRILRLFQRRGLLEPHTVDDMLTWRAPAASASTPPSASTAPIALVASGSSATAPDRPSPSTGCGSSATPEGGPTTMPASGGWSTSRPVPPPTAAPSSPSRPSSSSRPSLG